jgi:hypothetical protein
MSAKGIGFSVRDPRVLIDLQRSDDLKLEAEHTIDMGRFGMKPSSTLWGKAPLSRAD